MNARRICMVLTAAFLAGGGCNPGKDAPGDGTLQLFFDVNVDAAASLGLSNLTSLEVQSSGLLALTGRIALDAGGTTVLPARDRIIPGPSYSVAPGFVTQLRIEHPVVRFHFGDGSMQDVRVPSGPETGWKIVVDETKFPNGYPITSGHVTGVRLFLTLGDLFHQTGGGNEGTWMARPTIESDQFNVSDSAGYDPDILVVVFDPGASDNQIQSAIAAGGYTVEFAYPRSPPKLYKIKLPAGRSLRDAHSYFRSFSFVLAAAPSVVMTPRLTPMEGTPIPLGAIGADTGWQAIFNKLGNVGDPKVVLATIATAGFNVAHADLTDNIWLNQDEVTAVCPKAMCDVDGEPGITLKDFNDPSFPAQLRPKDIQPNNRVDCGDLTSLNSPYRNGIDDPPKSGNGFKDDICGFGFPDSPSIYGADNHDTAVTGIMGAAGNNQPLGGAVGVCWSCRIMPLVAPLRPAAVKIGNAAEFLSAVTYAVQNGAHVANFSAGVVLVPDNQSGLCPRLGGTLVPKEAFTTVVKELNDAVAAILPPPGSPTPLFTFAIGECGNNADDGNPNVYDFPPQAFFASPGWRATSITVGASVAALGKPGPYSSPSNNVGGPLQIAAPGNWTGMLNGGNDGNTFTDNPASSYATPVVAGVAGLVVAGNLGMYPDPDGALLKFQLLSKHVAANPELGSSVPGQREITMTLLP